MKNKVKFSLLLLSAAAMATLASCGGSGGNSSSESKSSAEPSVSSEAPVVTSEEAPVVTSEAPAATSEAAPVITSEEAPVATSEAAPVVTSEAPIATSEPIVQTSEETPVVTSESGRKAFLPVEDPSSEVTIEFWHCMGHAKTSAFLKVVDAFNAEYAGKYKVVEKQLAGTYQDLADKVSTKLFAGETAALAMGYPDNFADYMTADIEDSRILQLDDFIYDANFGLEQEEIDDFVPMFWDEGTRYHVNGTWSLPMYKSTEIMYYNHNFLSGVNDASKKKLAGNADWNEALSEITSYQSEVTVEELDEFKALTKAAGGYTYEVPTTWTEMVTVSKQIKADMAKEGINNSNFYPVGYDSDANLLISQFAQRGIGYTTNDNISRPTDHIIWQNEGAENFIEEVMDLFNQKLFITKELGGGKYTNERFTEGNSVFTIGSTGGSTYNVSSNFKVSLSKVPYYGEKPMYIQQGPSICLLDNNNPQVHKGAWLFYKYLSDPEANAKLALENSYDPVRSSSFSTKTYLDHIAKHEEGLQYDIPYHTAGLRQYYMTSPVFIGSARARNAISEVLVNVLQGDYPDEALEDAFDKVAPFVK